MYHTADLITEVATGDDDDDDDDLARSVDSLGDPHPRQDKAGGCTVGSHHSE